MPATLFCFSRIDPILNRSGMVSAYALSIPGKFRVVAMTPLGYPADEPHPRPRKEINDIVCFESYS